MLIFSFIFLSYQKIAFSAIFFDVILIDLRNRTNQLLKKNGGARSTSPVAYPYALAISDVATFFKYIFSWQDQDFWPVRPQAKT